MAKVNCSNYLVEKIEELAELVDLLNQKYDYVSVLGTDVKGKTFQVSKTSMSIEDYSDNECGFVIRILNHGRYFEYAFNHWDDIDDLESTINRLVQDDLQIQKESNIENYDSIECHDDLRYESSDCSIQITLEEKGIDEIFQTLTRIKNRILSLDERILNVSLGCNYVHVSKAFFAANKELTQGYVFTEALVSVTVASNGVVKRDYGVLSGIEGLELLDHLENKAKETAINALELLDAKVLKPGMYDVICAPDISGLIAHEAFGHGVEMDMFVKNRAKAKDYLGKQVASPLVTMIDGARPKKQVASYLFDDEGNIGQETVLIKNGILINGINDEASALRLKVMPTGNGRRESYERKAYSRMTNTYFEKGTSKLEDMIASIEYGFLLEGVENGMEDPKHWGIECNITKAREIVDGKLTGNIYAPIIMTGYVPDLLMSISMVSDEEVLSGGGSCGKGYKEFVKVSDGGPYLKAKARLG